MKVFYIQSHKNTYIYARPGDEFSFLDLKKNVSFHKFNDSEKASAVKQ